MKSSSWPDCIGGEAVIKRAQFVRALIVSNSMGKRFFFYSRKLSSHFEKKEKENRANEREKAAKNQSREWQVLS
jgi:hypothetical protein